MFVKTYDGKLVNINMVSRFFVYECGEKSDLVAVMNGREVCIVADIPLEEAWEKMRKLEEKIGQVITL